MSQVIESGRVGRSLAFRIAGQTGLIGRLECTWWSADDDPQTGGGWCLSWVDGPTIEQMTFLTVEMRHHEPALQVGTSHRYRRSGSELGQAVALLHHLQQSPASGAQATADTVRIAFDATGWPERLPSTWQARGHALLAADPGRTHRLTPAAVLRLSDYIRTQSWDGAMRWLDRRASATAASQ
jgi:hypothetical protein